MAWKVIKSVGFCFNWKREKKNRDFFFGNQQKGLIQRKQKKSVRQRFEFRFVDFCSFKEDFWNNISKIMVLKQLEKELLPRNWPTFLNGFSF